VVLIFSDTEDQSAGNVILWLEYLEEPYIRITENSKITNVFIAHDTTTEINQNKSIGLSFSVDGKELQLSEIKSVWIRRGQIRLGYSYQLSKNDDINKYLQYHYENDMEDLKNFIFSQLNSQCYVLGSIHINRMNKLETLLIASEVGLKIPNWKISGDTEKLKKIEDLNNPIIMKGISETLDFPIPINNKSYKWYTSRYESSKERKVFWPTLFQVKIKKQFELRILYVDGTFFSTAIFSHLDSNSEIDFRKGNANELIYHPYTLPNEIKNALQKLMFNCNLNFGSIDMIYSQNNEYYFLEVNPMGQYDYYAQVCNFNVDKYIAQKLICNE
jgi:ATP-GRASP peptide maturase of grasp-with-spasm system